MFVSFEGCDGSGKSTQLRLVKEYLEKTSQHAIYVREPGSTSISEQIRGIILDEKNKEMSDITEALLYAASRAQLVHEIIKPALERGELVICDRYVDSSIAYQGSARNMGADLIAKINEPAVDGCMPDLTIFIDLEPQKCWRSLKGSNDRLEQENAEFHQKVYEGYVAQMKASSSRFVAIKPDFDKNVTSQKIIDAMRKVGAIK